MPLLSNKTLHRPRKCKMCKENAAGKGGCMLPLRRLTLKRWYEFNRRWGK